MMSRKLELMDSQFVSSYFKIVSKKIFLVYHGKSR